MFQTKVAEKIKAHIVYYMTFFFWGGIVPFMRYEAKYCRVRQATDDSMAHVHCMLEAYCYQHTFRICNTVFLVQKWLHKCASV